MSKANVKEIAKWVHDTGLERTTSQNYIIDYDDVIECFNVTKEFLKENHEDISDALWECGDLLDFEDEIKNGEIVGWNMMFEGTACCKVCGNTEHKECYLCEVCHPEEWDEEEEEELRPIITQRLKDRIKKYGLSNIFNGNLSKVPNDRYTRATIIFVGMTDKELPFDKADENFLIVFNRYEDGFWSVWETPRADFETIKKIKDYELGIYNRGGRRMWDSFQMYYDNGDKLYNVVNVDNQTETN